MSAADHDRFYEDVGAYLLGALDESERDAFEAHLEVCHVCQDEVGRLKVAVDALPRSVEQFHVPDKLRATLMEQVRAEPRGNGRAPARGRGSLSRLFARPRATLAASACALLVGLGVGFLLSSGDGDGGTRTVVAQVDTSRIGDSHAQLVLPEDGDGPARLEVSSMPQPPEGKVYEIWLQRGMEVEPASLFSVDRNGNGVGAVPGDLKGVTAVLVTRERAGGAMQPTEQPVVSAKT